MNNTLLQASIPTEYKRYLKMAAFDSGMTVTKYLLKLIEKRHEGKRRRIKGWSKWISTLNPKKESVAKIQAKFVLDMQTISNPGTGL